MLDGDGIDPHRLVWTSSNNLVYLVLDKVAYNLWDFSR